MTVSMLFALVGTVILLGFLGNLLFKLTKIPSVLLLIAIGVMLGPVTGWIQHDALLDIAPYFGAAALLVILFEGGLELDIAHVIRHAPRTAMFASVVFAVSMAAVAFVAHTYLGFSLNTALMLGAILGATSPAICISVVSGLSVRHDVKTVVKLESVMGEVLLIVSVVLLIQGHETGATDAADWLWGFARSWSVALVVASVAGVLWSRLVGWLGREPLSYMLTLGVVCLLHFVVEELHGSPAIAVLLFGLILANMQTIAGRFGPRFSELFGIDIREEQFVLNQFVMNITAELSFLVRTFFFVYLGLILDFSALSWTLGLWIGALFLLLLGSRRLGIALFKYSGSKFSVSELQVVMALQPRGLATAVVAFMPIQAGVPGAELFPLYAFVMIVLTNLYMTGGILFAERRLKQEAQSEPDVMPTPLPPVAPLTPSPVVADRRAPLFSPAREFEDEPAPRTFVDWMARLFGLRLEDRETEYIEMIRASYLSDAVYWVQAALAAAICALGLILGQTAIVIGAALIVPLVRPVIATGLALGSGDIYLLAKLVAKLLGFSVVTVGISAVIIDLLPFAVPAAEIASRTRPTILDFLVALCGGMSGAALISLRRRGFYYLPGALIAITLLPSLCVMGFSLAYNFGSPVFVGAALQFTTNLFAAVLGAGAVLLLVGVPHAAQSPLVRQWKEEVLAAPIAHTVFGRLRLQYLVGRTGSVRARLVVVGIFLLALLIPLQQAFNQLTLEFRTRQAVSQLQTMFAVPDRSSITSSSFAMNSSGVDVQLRVATNTLFGADDIAHFEQRVSEQAGRPARLDLVQTIADVGTAGTLERLLSDRAPGEPEATTRGVSESLANVGRVVTQVLAGLPLPDSWQVVTIRSDLGGPAAIPALDIVYLADAALSDDARTMIVQLLATQTGVGADGIALQWVPSTWPLRFSRTGQPLAADTPSLAEVRTLLADHPTLHPVLAMPSGISDAATRTLTDAVARALGVDDVVVEVTPADADAAATRTATVSVRPVTGGSAP